MENKIRQAIRALNKTGKLTKEVRVMKDTDKELLFRQLVHAFVSKFGREALPKNVELIFEEVMREVLAKQVDAVPMLDQKVYTKLASLEDKITFMLDDYDMSADTHFKHEHCAIYTRVNQENDELFWVEDVDTHTVLEKYFSQKTELVQAPEQTIPAPPAEAFIEDVGETLSQIEARVNVQAQMQDANYEKLIQACTSVALAAMYLDYAEDEQGAVRCRLDTLKHTISQYPQLIKTLPPKFVEQIALSELNPDKYSRGFDLSNFFEDNNENNKK